MAKLPKDLNFNDVDGDERGRHAYTPHELNMMRRASKSFENLVALANDQERLNAARKVARKAVWRDVGEPPVYLDTLRECLEHASKGALREFSFTSIWVSLIVSPA